MIAHHPPASLPHSNHLNRILTAHGAGGESLLVETAAGLSVEILVDPGLDIGRVAIGGQPVSFVTARGAAWPPGEPAGGWLERWVGGLVTTCGLRNVGIPDEGHGQHGDYIGRRAVGVQAAHGDIDGEPVVVVRGVVRDNVALSHHLEVERTVTIWTQTRRIGLEDRLTNYGHRDEQVPLLYHVNLGQPFLTPDTVVHGIKEFTVRDTASACDTDWPAMGSGQRGETELVAECTLVGPPRVVVKSPVAGYAVQVGWDAGPLPRLHVWRRRTADAYVLAIEPANCSLLGRSHDRDVGRAPMVAPGEPRTTTLDLLFIDTPSV